MHHHGIIHHDMAARNVLVDEDDVARVCDFGMAAQAGQRVSDLVAVKWGSPEGILKKTFTTKSDGMLYADVCTQCMHA